MAKMSAVDKVGLSAPNCSKNCSMENVGLATHESSSFRSSSKMYEIDRQLKKFKDDAFQCQQFQDDAFQQFKDDTFHNRSYTASINENSVEQNYERMLSVDRNAEIQEYKNDIEKLLRVNNSLVLETAFLRKENIMRSNRLKEQEATILSLRSEICRLLESHDNLSAADVRVLKEQLNVYHEDFNTEKKERMKLKERNIFLQTQLEEAKNVLENQRKKLLLYSEILPDSVGRSINLPLVTAPKCKMVFNTQCAPSSKISSIGVTNQKQKCQLQENPNKSPPLNERPGGVKLKSPLRKSPSNHLETYQFSYQEKDSNFSPYSSLPHYDETMSSQNKRITTTYLDNIDTNSITLNSETTSSTHLTQNSERISSGDSREYLSGYELNRHSDKYTDLDPFSDIICKRL